MVSDPMYPEYECLNDFIEECLQYGKVTDPYDCDGYTVAELLVISIQQQVSGEETAAAEGLIKTLEAENERLTQQIGTWRQHTEETWKELLDKAKVEIERLSAEVAELKTVIVDAYAELTETHGSIERNMKEGTRVLREKALESAVEKLKEFAFDSADTAQQGDPK